MNCIDIECTVNGQIIRKSVPCDMLLIVFLRDVLGLTGTKYGCGEGECGACTVIVNGRNVNSCLFPVIQADGAEIITIEGIEQDGELSDIQKSFLEHGAVQCGFCSPGMVMSASALLERNPYPDEKEIRRGMSGNLCRCTGYQAIVNAVRAVAEERECK